MIRQPKRDWRSSPSEWSADTLKVVTTLGLILLFALAVILLAMTQFSIYQKKYGNQMTFVDFILDSGK